MTVYSNKLVINVSNVNVSNCSTVGTLTVNGQTYCMNWKLMPSYMPLNTIGTGTLVVQGDAYNGTYNTPVYLYDNYLYVWPKMEFSMISTTPYS